MRLARKRVAHSLRPSAAQGENMFPNYASWCRSFRGRGVARQAGPIRLRQPVKTAPVEDRWKMAELNFNL